MTIGIDEYIFKVIYIKEIYGEIGDFCFRKRY